MTQQLRHKKNTGFTMIEVLISVGIFALILLMIVSVVFWMNYYNSKTKADSQVQENARRVMEVMAYEIKGAKGVYTSTTTSNQLSLETLHYLPNDETTTYIDFFLCGSAICLKKESQNPVTITSDTVQASSLQFIQITNGTSPSVKINLTLSNVNPVNDASHASSVNLTSTVALRSY